MLKQVAILTEMYLRTRSRVTRATPLLPSRSLSKRTSFSTFGSYFILTVHGRRSQEALEILGFELACPRIFQLVFGPCWLVTGSRLA